MHTTPTEACAERGFSTLKWIAEELSERVEVPCTAVGGLAAYGKLATILEPG
jgi:hypothetical protein